MGGREIERTKKDREGLWGTVVRRTALCVWEKEVDGRRSRGGIQSESFGGLSWKRRNEGLTEEVGVGVEVGHGRSRPSSGCLVFTVP